MQNNAEISGGLARKNYQLISLLTFILLIFVLQSVYAYIYANNSLLRNNDVVQVIIRFSTWTAPVFVYLIIFKKNPFDYLKVRKNILKGLTWGIVISILIALYNIIGAYFLKGQIKFDFNISQELWWKAIILVGFSEEVLFRGFLLPKIEELSERFWLANILNAVLFTLIHFPGWIFLGNFVLPNILGSIGYIIIFGLIQGVVFKKSDSLWGCMLIHSVNNFLSFVVV